LLGWWTLFCLSWWCMLLFSWSFRRVHDSLLPMLLGVLPRLQWVPFLGLWDRCLPVSHGFWSPFPSWARLWCPLGFPLLMNFLPLLYIW
jgi:hypothetical protein